MRVGQSLRAIQRCLKDSDLGVKHVSAGGYAGTEPLADNPSRFGRRTHGVVGGTDRSATGLNLGDPLTDFE
jgi:hypothetical protein